MLDEFSRCWRILLNFVGSLLAAFAIAAVAAVAGVGIIVGGKMLGFESLYTLGGAVIIVGVCFSAWRVIAAEIVAIATLMNWRRHG